LKMSADNARTVLHFEGWFRSTTDISYYTDASFLSQCDRRVPVLVELLCDNEPRMHCVPARPIWLKIKFSLENQPWILTMANWPVLVSSNSNDRSTKHFVQDAELCCQYLLSHNEAMHAFMFSVSSRAIPHSLYSMNAYSTQSFRMTNEKENRTTFCRFHFTAVQNENPLKSQLITNDVNCQTVDDLWQQAVDEIAKGNFLTWRVDIQIFTAAEVAYLPFDAFDSTKVWPHKLSPLVPVGKVVLNKVVHHSTEFTGSNSTIGCMPVCKAVSTTEELELTNTDDNGRILTDDACSKKLLTADEYQTMDPFWQSGILWRTIFDENERDQVATRIAQYIRPISSPTMTSVLDLFAQVDEELPVEVEIEALKNTRHQQRRYKRVPDDNIDKCDVELCVDEASLHSNVINDIFCHGPLLDVIQKSRLFQDSKYFVDMALLYDPDVVLQAFDTVENKTDPKALDMFIKKYFSPPGSELKECQPVDWVPRPKSFLKIADEHFRLWAYFVHGKWKKLCREVTDQVKTEPNRFTFISVPHPFIIPGGRFREFYYWDTYWILKGLLASEMYETARNMILNFATIIDQFGFVPNGGRIYYKNRSQPPLLTMSVWDYYQATKDKAVLVNMLPRLEKELQFWYKNRGYVYKDENGKTLQLHQYRVDTDLPRAESYTEDLASASLEFTEAGKKRIWSDIVSACESGIDFGTRWFRRDGDLNKTVRSIRTRRIVPVDLQAVLCGSEAVLSRLYNVLGDQTMAEVHQKKYQRMKEDLHDAFWDPIDKMWYDIDLDERDGRGAKSPTFYPSNLAPLYFDCVLNDKKKVGQQIAKYLEENGISSMPYGIPSSMHASDEQWDRPNGWAPHNHMVIEGLRKSGDIFAQQIAFKVAQNWIDGVWFVFFQYAGKMFEKYRVEGHYGIGGGGEYTVQEGFGWTNGVILDLLMTYGEELKREGPYPNYAIHRKKRMKLIMKKLRAGKASINEENQFELFISSTEIRYCYYSETHKILGNTYGMCVLQDFEAMTPNLLARTIETVEGGGLVVILLHSLHSIRQLHAMTMDVHSRYRTEAHQDVVARFNERFLLSLASCKTCLLLDDELNVLPLSSAVSAIDPASAEAKQKVASNATELKQLIESMSDAPTVGKLLKQCKTLDQEHIDYEVVQSVNPEFNKAVVRINVTRGQRQTIQNSPNDLQMMSDAPAHHLFVLLGPFVQNSNNIPEILCVVQVCLEGDLSKASVHTSLTSGKRPSGDLIPWTLVQQFQDEDFPSLCGARIVRIATHPDYQRMGYGLRAVQLLQRYYEGKFPALDDPTTSAIDIVPIEFNMSSHNNEKRGLLDEHVSQRKKLPPLLSRLYERSAERLDWIGVSYGLTETLQRFWARSQFFPVYIRQIANELTGEYSCIMLKTLNTDQPWLIAYWTDFRRRFISLLSNPFSHFPAPLALGILAKPNLQILNAQAATETTPLDRKELAVYFTNHDLKRIEMYSRNLIDHHLIVDLVPSIGKLYFLGKLNINLNAVEVAILLAFGLQLKNVADLGKELKLQSAQVLALFNRIIIKSIQCMNEICESAVECEFGIEKQPNLQIAGLQRSLDEELNEYAEEEKEKADRQLSIQLSESELKMYRIEAIEQSMLEDVEQRTVPTGKRKLFKKKKSSKKRPRKQNVQV
ncbi:Trehalase, partial [Trichinella patagoniensis]